MGELFSGQLLPDISVMGSWILAVGLSSLHGYMAEKHLGEN